MEERCVQHGSREFFFLKKRFDEESFMHEKL